MRIISSIDNQEVVKKILKHLGLWLVKSKPPPRANSPPSELLSRNLFAHSVINITFIEIHISVENIGLPIIQIVAFFLALVYYMQMGHSDFFSDMLDKILRLVDLWEMNVTSIYSSKLGNPSLHFTSDSCFCIAAGSCHQKLKILPISPPQGSIRSLLNITNIFHFQHVGCITVFKSR